MTNAVRITLFSMLGALVLFTGCASKKKTNKQISALQAQVGTITDELVRLDQALQETRAAIQSEETRRNDLQSQLGVSRARLGSLHEEESVIRGIYRTPSGFELPSISIQKALKNAGYYQGNLDGKIGSQTRDAIRAFQGDNGLDADGVVGRKTWGKLKGYLETVK